MTRELGRASDEIDGYSAEQPVADVDWFDEVGWALNYRERERKNHDLDGWFAHEAGSPQCLALGHVEPADGWEDDPDDHPHGWEGEPLCPATQYDVCCTQCEGECSGIEDDVTRDEFWRLPGVRGRVEC